jgi:hypothetical protein
MKAEGRRQKAEGRGQRAEGFNPVGDFYLKSRFSESDLVY